MPGVIVHIVAADGNKQDVRTDARGAFHVRLRGGEAHVFIDGPGKVSGSVATGEHAIEIRDLVPPAVAAKPKKRPDVIPPYTDAAIDANWWTRAWLMLHVDARGEVTHVKLLGDPGFGLGASATRAAFAVRFEPARDRADRPTPTLVLWSYEWPSYWWLQSLGRGVTRLPGQVGGVPCRAKGSKRAVARDCSSADIAGASRRPWVARPAP